MDHTRQLGLALSAATAGLAWGYLRARRHPRAGLLAALQGLDWFVAAGGAAALIAILRAGLEEEQTTVEEFERVTRSREIVHEE